MSYDYKNYKVFIAPNDMVWTNTGAGTVALTWASDVPTLNHTAADNTPVLEINVAKTVKRALALSGQNSMKINNIKIGAIIGTAALGAAVTAEGHKLSVNTTTGLITSATVALTGTIPLAISTGVLSTFTPADPVEITNYDDFNIELTADCAATSVLKITSMIIDVDVMEA